MMLVEVKLGEILVVRVEGRVVTVDGSEVWERGAMVRVRRASTDAEDVRLRGGRRRVGRWSDLRRLSLLERDSRLTCLELREKNIRDSSQRVIGEGEKRLRGKANLSDPLNGVAIV